MLGATLDTEAKALVHEAGALGRRGWDSRTIFALLGAAVVTSLAPAAAPLVWLAGVLIWEWGVTPLAVNALAQQRDKPDRDIAAQIALTGVGATLYALYPFLLFPEYGVLGGMLAVIWLAGSMIHATTYLAVNTRILAAGLAPVVIAGLVLPWLYWGWEWSTALVSFGFLSLTAMSVIYAIESSRFLDMLNKATHKRTSDAVAERAAADMIAIVSHELRTPVSAIEGYTDLLAAHAAEGKTNGDDIEKIREASARLRRLVQRAIDIMRLDSGGVETTLSHVEPVALLTEIAAIWRGPALARGNVIRVLDSYGLPVLVDAPKMRVCLECLLENAIKFTADGVITIGLEQDAEHLKFFVLDSGAGIPDEALAYVTRPFRQADMSASRAHEGAGLGLALADRLARVMGGSLTIEQGEPSAAGRGARVTVRLPQQNAVTAAR